MREGWGIYWKEPLRNNECLSVHSVSSLFWDMSASLDTFYGGLRFSGWESWGQDERLYVQALGI